MDPLVFQDLTDETRSCEGVELKGKHPFQNLTHQILRELGIEMGSGMQAVCLIGMGVRDQGVRVCWLNVRDPWYCL